MRALVAGGTGFIGRHVVQELLDHGWSVTVTSRQPVAVNRACYSDERLRCEPADLADTGKMSELLRGASLFVHLVHATVPAESMADLTCDLSATLVPTVRLLGRLPPDCRKVIFVSSGGTVYGRTTDVPTTEDHPTDPRSAYGAAKLAIEKYIQICMSLANVSAAIVRPANVYGPGQRSDRPQGAIAVFLDRLLRNLPIEVFGDGKIVRDYIHVRDVASAVRLLADHEPSGTWNVGSGIGYALNELIALIERTTERHVTVQYGPARAYDVPHNVLDATRLTQAVGWQPTISLESGIRMQFESLIGKPPTHAVAWRPDR